MKLSEAIELHKVGNPSKQIRQIQMSNDLYQQLLMQMGVMPKSPSDVLTVHGIPIVVLMHAKENFFQFVF